VEPAFSIVWWEVWYFVYLCFCKSEFRQTDEYEKADCLSAMGISADGDCGTGDAL
jgi:hypothetical protein